MLKILIPLLSLSLSTSALHNFDYNPSAASEAQIRFALENHYDDTGPGAKGPVYAYNTYRTLEDALVGYLDDPDTKLPESEKKKAVNNLFNKENKKEEFQRFYPKTVEEYTGYNKMPSPQPQAAIPFLLNKPRLQSPVVLTRLPPKKYYQSNKDVRGETAEAYRLHKLAPIRGNPLSLAHYTRDPDLQIPHDQFDPHPKYTYSYGVHNADTGDSKSAKETRDSDGSVRGYYSFVDPDGKIRTVSYIADDKLGFRANVERS